MAAVTAVGASSWTASQAKPHQPTEPGDERPNVLIVLTDDQRGGLSVMPQTRRFFGSGGTRWDHAYANTPLCCPARATLMTGQYPHNHGVITNTDWELLVQDHTLQAHLQADGYRTAIFGKYLNWFPVTEMDPPYFDRFGIFQTGGPAPYYRRATWNIDGEVAPLDDYSTTLIEDLGVDFIRESQSEPWFMILSVPAAHAPRRPSPEYRRARVGPWGGNPAVREEDRSDKPPWVQGVDVGLGEGRMLRKEQLRTLMSVDDLVGAVAAELERTGQAEDTLAFFTTDNGYLWGEHGVKGKPPPYIPAVRVPLFARWPGHFSGNTVSEELVSHIDVTATIYEAVGLSPEHELDGYSLFAERRRTRLLMEMLSRAKNSPIWSSLLTADGVHYIEYYDGLEIQEDQRNVIFRELYDLTSDPWELENLAAQGPTIDSLSLSAELATMRRCRAEKCP